ncbi:hypothetical protein [uncultured Ferrovibrio sp.]|jgi:hypothetical protein|uniref:hypothetical protein n=1 Tax=uncultured Ferrovibrio sp. TaxID=1576913 RepID=UPI002633404F|nr:hypothetical protein [uncultured Ferrovibrio sp.]
MSISGIGGLGVLLPSFSPSSSSAASGLPTEEIEGRKSVQDEFLDYARMSVAERIRAQILEDKGLTEERLAELDAEKRKAIEEEIRQAIEEKMKVETGKTEGTMADLRV